MREIKFRIWYYDQKKFDNNVELKDFKRYSFPLHWCCVQQYTGLKDKNGNLIYEGDIVQNMIIGPVEYFLGEFSIGGVTPLKDFLISPSDENQPLNFNLDLEIIGNIFETPELLK